MHEDDARLIAEVRRALDEGATHLDAATRARLAQARGRAQARRPARWHWWLPAGGAVLASLLVAAVWLGQPAPVPGNGLDSVTDFELLTANDDLELFEQMDFYQWLEEEGMHAG
jgi:hypothetical protein